MMNAYDLELTHGPVDRSDPANHGWAFGFPPGITPDQWPLDPNNGYPLMHGFTLRLPEDHRVHGPEIVALSFFATAPDHNDGMPVEGLRTDELLGAHPDAPPADPELARIWKVARVEHPRLHRMTDILDCAYAVILLTEDEFRGPLAAVPDMAESLALARAPRPGWLDRGKKEARKMGAFLESKLGASPDSAADFNRAIVCARRQGDPNAGIKAEEFPDEGSPYTSPHDPETYELRAWAKELAANHIGGTMQPVQGVPDFGPHYIGFEEYFGDYNFGGGNAQLDFESMQFDWACG